MHHMRARGAAVLLCWPRRSLRLPAYWAHCEVHVLKDVAAAREVWEGVVKGGLGRYAEAWEATAAMERSLRNIKEARAVYKRAYSRRLEEGGQLALCYAWLRFEREEGRCGRAACARFHTNEGYVVHVGNHRVRACLCPCRALTKGAPLVAPPLALTRIMVRVHTFARSWPFIPAVLAPGVCVCCSLLSADDYLQALLKVQPFLEEATAAQAAAADAAAAAAAEASCT